MKLMTLLVQLILLKALIAFLYLMARLVPFFNRLEGLAGINALPPLALLVSLLIIPAYGFHLTDLPLLIYGVLANLYTFLLAQRQNRLLSLLMMILLTVAMAFSLLVMDLRFPLK
jgi:hypothetical protein